MQTSSLNTPEALPALSYGGNALIAFVEFPAVSGIRPWKLTQIIVTSLLNQVKGSFMCFRSKKPDDALSLDT